MAKQGTVSGDRSWLEYPRGAVRLTSLRDVQCSAGEYVSLAEILDAGHITEALLTTFQLDGDWLLSHFPPTTPLTLVANDASSLDTAPTRARITIVQPEMVVPRVQIVHSKIMILFYAARMRLVVATANLVEDEWSVMHNAVFLQDFPLDPSIVFAANEFSTSLAYSLHDLSIPYGIIARLNNVDFSAATARIVTTVPTGEPRRHMNMTSYGMLRLAHVVRESQKNANSQAKAFEPDARLFCASSSLGKLDIPWLRDLYLCAHGLDPQPLSLGTRQQMVPSALVDIALGFHTHSQVTACRFGPQCGRYIMARRDTYDAATFPKDMLFHLEPRVSGALVHAKAIVARTGVEQKTGWVYIGSHNCTPAAWGRLFYNGVPYFNNYEFGVVLPNV
ncbi:hypothetical protein LPJ61_006433, partial [Coemansia biformis]